MFILRFVCIYDFQGKFKAFRPSARVICNTLKFRDAFCLFWAFGF
jgi:hypothetical protein